MRPFFYGQAGIIMIDKVFYVLLFIFFLFFLCYLSSEKAQAPLLFTRNKGTDDFMPFATKLVFNESKLYRLVIEHFLAYSTFCRNYDYARNTSPPLYYTEPEKSVLRKGQLKRVSSHWRPLITFPSTLIRLIDKGFCIAPSLTENPRRVEY